MEDNEPWCSISRQRGLGIAILVFLCPRVQWENINYFAHFSQGGLEGTSGSGEVLGWLYGWLGDLSGLITGTRWKLLSPWRPRWHPPITSHWSLWPMNVILIPLSTEAKMVNELVPLQPFQFSLYLWGSPSPSMSVWGLQEAETEIKLNCRRFFFWRGGVKPIKDKRGEGIGVGRGNLQIMMWVWPV